jgi:hypothetical protein
MSATRMMDLMRRFSVASFRRNLTSVAQLRQKYCRQAYSSAVEVAHDIETIEKEGIHKRWCDGE